MDGELTLKDEVESDDPPMQFVSIDSTKLEMALDQVFSSKDKTRLVLIQSDASQNALPLIRHAIHASAK